MNKELSQSQFDRLMKATKATLDWKTIIHFGLTLAMVLAAFYTLRERVSLVENDVKHLTERVNKVEEMD